MSEPRNLLILVGGVRLNLALIEERRFATASSSSNTPSAADRSSC